LSDAASRNAANGRESFKGPEAPWNDFVPSIRPHIEQLVVSHRPEHKLSGQLHDETLYGPPHEANGKPYVHVRKPVEALSKNEVEEIVDPAVRAAVQARLAELGDVKNLETQRPCLTSNKGEHIPIRRVRIRKSLATRPVAEGPRLRHVAPNNNHHMEIVAQLDEKESEIRWEGVPVSPLEAQNRQRKGLPVIQRDHGKGYLFKFSLMGGDVIEVQSNGAPERFLVCSVWSEGRMTLIKINDARKQTEIRAAKQVWFPGAESLRKAACRKITVDVLGKVHPAND